MAYQPKSARFSKDPAKRQKQLDNLKRRWDTKPLPVEVTRKGHRPPDKYPDDPAGFISDHFFVIEGRKLIELLDWQTEIIESIFHSQPTKNLAVIGQPKKTGKSTLLAAVAEWYLVNRPFAEVYLLASDVQQTQLVCFDKLVKSIRMNPVLRSLCKVKPGKGRIEYRESSVQILAPNTSLAGINPSLIIAEELWSWTTMEHRRSWDELTNVPTREDNLILVSSYAGYSEDEGSILWDLYSKGVAQREGREETDSRFYFHWFGEELYEKVPWVKPGYLPQQRRRLRENSYRRLHRNEWVSGEEAFVDVATLELCTNPDLQRGLEHEGDVVIGIDIGLKHDASAVAVIGKVGDGLLLLDHALFKPPRGGVLNLERTVEDFVKLLNKRYKIREVRYDPFQFERSAQSLRGKGIRAIEFPQTANNCVLMTDCLQSLLKSANITLYESDEVRSHLLNCKVKEVPNRGWRIIKSSQSHKIDLAVAIALACAGAQEILLLRTKATMTILDLGDDEDEDDSHLWTPCGTIGAW